MDRYQSDHVFLPSIVLIEEGSIEIVVIEEKFSDASLLVLIGETAGWLKLHRLYLNQCIISVICRSP